MESSGPSHERLEPDHTHGCEAGVRPGAARMKHTEAVLKPRPLSASEFLSTLPEDDADDGR